jgi:ubiquinone/menaquinone biosynthesis C-methylase UbiE
MVYDPARQWERYGALDPYYGVLSAPDFHHARLDAETRERFFATGRRHVTDLMTALESQIGPDFQFDRVLDYGCGVGRLTLPLAERSKHVYGVDVSHSMLSEAADNARRMNFSNVEWVEADRLAELSGRYDLAHSFLVFQHIPVREGERIFAALLRGLRPGGVGVIHITLQPSHPLAGFFHWTMKTIPFAYNIFNLMRGRGWSYPHMQMNPYSLTRLGGLLADGGITEWHTRFQPGNTRMAYDCAVITFQKNGGR